MDTKHTVDAFGIHEICQKLQELGEQVHALSERSTVSIAMSWEIALPEHYPFCWPILLTLDPGHRYLSKGRSLLPCQINLAFHVQRLEDNCGARDSLRDP